MPTLFIVYSVLYKSTNNGYRTMTFTHYIENLSGFKTVLVTFLYSLRDVRNYVIRSTTTKTKANGGTKFVH